MLVSLIITTYNRPDALLLVLKSVESQTLLPNEVIIADDGSNEDTKTVIKKFSSTSCLKIIHSWHEDRGFRVARSRNQAILKSNGEYLILIDGDMVLHSEFVKDHIKNAEEGCFVQGGRVLLNEVTTKDAINTMKIGFSFISNGLRNRKNSIHSNLLSKLFSNKKKYLSRIKSCNMAFFEKDFYRVNGFNNDFEGWGREDSEFAARLLNTGISCKSVRFNSIQFHLWHIDNNRLSLKKNDLLLESTIKNNSNWCNNGVNSLL